MDSTLKSVIEYPQNWKYDQLGGPIQDFPHSW